MTFTDETLERRALDCEQVASWLRFMFGADEQAADLLMVRAKEIRAMKRGC